MEGVIKVRRASSEGVEKVVVISGTMETVGKMVYFWGTIIVKGLDDVRSVMRTVATGVARMSLLMSVQSQSPQQ